MIEGCTPPLFFGAIWGLGRPFGLGRACGLRAARSRNYPPRPQTAGCAYALAETFAIYPHAIINNLDALQYRGREFAKLEIPVR